jgi:hypothetical protein
MNPFVSGVILMRVALGSSLGASPFISMATRLAIAIGLGVSHPGSIWQAGAEWKQASDQLEEVKTRLANANAKVNPQWAAEDKDAYLNAAATYTTEVEQLKKYLDNSGTAMQAIAALYYAFILLASISAAFTLALAIAVALAAATPAGSVVRGIAEAIVGKLVITVSAAAKSIIGIAAAGSAILVAGATLMHLFTSQPGGVQGADFQQIKIDYRSPTFDPDPQRNQYVAPKRNLPELPS